MWNVKSGVILFLLGALSAQPATAQPQTLTGWFSFIVADYPTESGLASETTYFLTEDSGKRHELLIDTALMQPLGGSVTLNRKRVTVEGEWEHDPVRFRVRSIELAPSPSTALPGRPLASDLPPDGPPPPRSDLPAATTSSSVRGSQAWVTILCRFGGATGVTPHPQSHYEQLMRASYPGLDHYWKEVSYGNIPDLVGSKTVGWYNLPQPRSYYAPGTELADVDLDALLEDCTAAADANVFFPDFYGINLGSGLITRRAR